MTLSEIKGFLDAEVLIGEGQLNMIDVIDIGAILMGHRKKPSPENFQLAEELNIPILATKHILFEIAGRLHNRNQRFHKKVGGKKISVWMKSCYVKTGLPSAAEALTMPGMYHTVSRQSRHGLVFAVTSPEGKACRL